MESVQKQIKVCSKGVFKNDDKTTEMSHFPLCNGLAIGQLFHHPKGFENLVYLVSKPRILAQHLGDKHINIRILSYVTVEVCRV